MSSSERTDGAKPRLSCEKCTQRKVKCDKRNPCSNCQRAGVSCVPVERHRLPRGRHLNKRADNTGSDAELRERLARLEALVVQQQNAPQSAATFVKDGATGTSSSGVSSDASSAAYPSLPQPTFWNGIVQDSGILQQPLAASSAQLQTSLFGPELAPRRPSTYVESVERDSAAYYHRRLCEIYIANFDPIFKILHGPSLSAFMLQGKDYLHYTPGHVAVEALEYAVYFAAVATLSDEGSISMFGAAKAIVFQKYRQACENALNRADYILTEDLTVLQAYVLYLIASRTQDRSRRVWTMLALALRIAQALMLHVEGPAVSLMRPFEREMRRRLWWSIGLLDVQGALERGHETMIPTTWLKESMFPMIIDDANLPVREELDVKEAPNIFTEMTYNRITCRAQTLGRLLNFPPHDGVAIVDWHHRHRLVDEFRASVFDLLQRSSRTPEQEAFYWWTFKGAEMLTNVMALIAIRPLRQQPCQHPPNVRGPNILKLALTVLAKMQNYITDARMTKYRWIETLFQQWHAFAIALAEFCACDDETLIRSSWPQLDITFERLKDLVADDHLNVWGPIEKLMAAARRKIAQTPNVTNVAGVSKSEEPVPITQNSAVSAFPGGVGNHGYLNDPTPAPVTDLSADWMDVWNPLDDPLDLMATTSLDSSNTAAWATWDAFMGDLQIPGEPTFSFM